LPPNSLNVTLNREALEYTQKTLTNLETALNKAMDEYEREFIAKFDIFRFNLGSKEISRCFPKQPCIFQACRRWVFNPKDCS